MEALRWLETLGPIEALKASFYIYPLVNALHIMAIGGVLTTVLLMDAAILGTFREPGVRHSSARLRPVALAAFVVAASTGFALFSVRASEYAFNPAFRIKMLLLILAGLNLLAFRRFAGADPRDRGFAVRLTAGLSILLWISILVAGRFIGFV